MHVERLWYLTGFKCCIKEIKCCETLLLKTIFKYCLLVYITRRIVKILFNYLHEWTINLNRFLCFSTSFNLPIWNAQAQASAVCYQLWLTPCLLFLDMQLSGSITSNVIIAQFWICRFFKNVNSISVCTHSCLLLFLNKNIFIFVCSINAFNLLFHCLNVD